MVKHVNSIINTIVDAITIRYFSLLQAIGKKNGISSYHVGTQSGTERNSSESIYTSLCRVYAPIFLFRTKKRKKKRGNKAGKDDLLYIRYNKTRKGKGEFRLYKQLADHGLKFYKYFEIARYFYNHVIRLVFAANFLRCKKERHARTGHVQIRSYLQIRTMTMFCPAEKISESTKSVRDTNNSEHDTSDVLNCYI